MKLLIGGKSRNIYMRKDGSAYYKSGGQQVDITHMFKKKGGGLKKKYIKGGSDEATFNKLRTTCNKLQEKLKALHDKLNPHTFTASGGSETATKDFIANDIIKDNFEGNKLLTKLADEINTALTEYAGGGVQKFEALIKLLKKDEVSTGIKSLLSTGGDGTIKKDLDEIAAVGTEAEFTAKKPDLLGKLNFFEEAIKEIKQIGETSGENEQTNTASTKDVNINTILSVDVLLNFPSGLEGFDRAFFTLAHLVISVISKINANKVHSLTITSTDEEKIIELVQKLNALINLFSQSHRGTLRGTNSGVFYNTTKFRAEVIGKAEAKFKTEYLEIVRAGTDKPNTYFIQGKQDIINKIICSIFTTFGSICKANEQPTTAPVGDPISKEVIATNINAFLTSKDVLAKEITIPPLP